VDVKKLVNLFNIDVIAPKINVLAAVLLNLMKNQRHHLFVVVYQ
jgi:hypothetical protein